MHLAIAYGEEELVDFLLEAGVDPENRDPDGDTSLLLCVNMCAAGGLGVVGGTRC
jgi:ankyrin repeat protein